MIGWILLGILGVIVLAFFIPVRVRVEYMDAWRVRVCVFGCIPVWNYPSPKPTEEAPAAEIEAAAAPPEKTAKKPSLKEELQTLFRDEGVGGVMSFFGKVIELLKTTLSSLAKFITVRKLALCVRVGGEEADETATRYGQLSAATATSLTVLSQLIRVKKPLVRVVPDFTSDKLDARLRMILWVWPFGVVGVALAALCRFMALWTKTIKTPSNGVHKIHKQPVSK